MQTQQRKMSMLFKLEWLDIFALMRRQVLKRKQRSLATLLPVSCLLPTVIYVSWADLFLLIGLIFLPPASITSDSVKNELLSHCPCGLNGPFEEHGTRF